MDKENVVYMHNRILCCHKEEWNYGICQLMERTTDYHDKWNNPGSKKIRSNILYHMWMLTHNKASGENSEFTGLDKGEYYYVCVCVCVCVCFTA